VKHPQKLFIRFTLLLVERAGELTGLFLVDPPKIKRGKKREKEKKKRGDRQKIAKIANQSTIVD